MSYGIDPYELVVTIEAYDDERSRRAGVLCRDHADSMVVPNGWTLDDRREAAPRLFQTRESVKVKPRRRVRRRRLTDDDTGQLRLGITQADLDAIPETPPRQRPSGIEPWQPVFDQTSDLDGLLAARGPLLARAFGGKRGKSAETKATGSKNDSARPAAPKGQPGERRAKPSS